MFPRVWQQLGEVLVWGLLNNIFTVFNFAVGAWPVKIAKLNPPRIFFNNISIQSCTCADSGTMLHSHFDGHAHHACVAMYMQDPTFLNLLSPKKRIGIRITFRGRKIYPGEHAPITLGDMLTRAALQHENTLPMEALHDYGLAALISNWFSQTAAAT